MTGPSGLYPIIPPDLQNKIMTCADHADNPDEEVSMKTVEEFMQRLQEDPEFELQAQAYENNDDFMSFAKSAGYDFTLDQLLEKFKHEEEGAPQPSEPPPVTAKTVEEFIQRLENEAEFELQAHAFENDDAFMEFVRREGYDFTLDQLTDGFKQGQGLLEARALVPVAPLEVAETLTPRLPSGSELIQPPDPVPDDAEAQKRPGTLFPKFEGVSGGRRRGMKWRNADS
jgi:predicted ribosomally synthesized peptide with nif11-like leader